MAESLESQGRYARSIVDADHARDPLTLLALDHGGAALLIGHGYPAGFSAPNRPGVLQTKWVARIIVRSPS